MSLVAETRMSAFCSSLGVVRETRRGGRTFDGRVVLVDEMALYELDGQAGLADATSANDDEFVFAQELWRRNRCQQSHISSRSRRRRLTQRQQRRRRRRRKEAAGRAQRTFEAIVGDLLAGATGATRRTGLFGVVEGFVEGLLARRQGCGCAGEVARAAGQDVKTADKGAWARGRLQRHYVYGHSCAACGGGYSVQRAVAAAASGARCEPEVR